MLQLATPASPSKLSTHNRRSQMFLKPLRLLSRRALHLPAHKYSPPISNPLAEAIPPNSWDSHMHVIGDPKTYPLSTTALYTATPHSLHSALRFESTLSLRNIVLVQPSIYGNDNACLLDALRSLGSNRARGVVTFDPDPTVTPPSTLRTWHALGVRGVRVNLKSVARSVSESELEIELRRYADAVRDLDWVLQVYIRLEDMSMLERIVPGLRVKVCVDHFGGPTIPSRFLETGEREMKGDPYRLEGFAALVRLLNGFQGRLFVKLSAPYRITADKGNERDVEPLAKELLRVAGMTGVVFATDWPHTRFEGLNIAPFADKCLRWCNGDENLVERLFRGNAEDLWSV